METPFLPSLFQRRQRPRKARSRTQSLRLFLPIYLRLHLPRTSSSSSSPPNPRITRYHRRPTQALCGRRHLRTHLSQNQPPLSYSFLYAGRHSLLRAFIRPRRPPSSFRLPTVITFGAKKRKKICICQKKAVNLQQIYIARIRAYA